jgi:hypothetical protein
MGYTFFGYNIPVFMSGEEFKADQVSLPRLERNLYGGGGPGGWLYGSWIQWDQITRQPHLDMLNDMKKMLRIRRENKDLIHGDRAATHILQVPSTPNGRPIPYVRYIPGEKAIVVVANQSHDLEETVTFTLNIPLWEMELGGGGQYKVTDLWTDTVTTVAEADLSHYPVTVPSSYATDGGIRAVKIERLAR